MAFCSNCGAQAQDGVKFCPSCGESLGGVPTQPQAPVYTAPAAPTAPVVPVQPQQPNYAPPTAPGAPAQYQPPVYTQQGAPAGPMLDEAQDAQANKGMAVLAYIIFFVPLIAGTHKTSPFVKFHTNQGTVLFLASLACSVALGIVSAIITAIFTATLAWGALLVIASIFSIIWLVYGIGVAVLAILGIVNAVNGRMKPLPVIGKFTLIK